MKTGVSRYLSLRASAGVIKRTIQGHLQQQLRGFFALVVVALASTPLFYFPPFFASLVFASLALVGCNEKEPLVASDRLLQAGAQAPDFEAKDLSGNTFKLSDVKGKVVLLNFWATWCTPCVLEMPSFERLSKTFQEKGLLVVAVNMDSVDREEEVKKFVERYGLSFKVLRDPTFEVGSRYGVTGYPETFIIDREGRLVSFNDPQTQRPLIRIISDRRWDSSNYLQEFEKLL